MQTNERWLVASAQLGDDSAFGELIAPYVGKLRFWIQGQFPTLRGDPPFADAIEARAFEDAKKGIKGFKCESIFSTWLHEVARNRAVTELKHRKRHNAPIDGRNFEAIAAAESAESGKVVSATDAIDKRSYHYNPHSFVAGDPYLQLAEKQRRELLKEGEAQLTPAESEVHTRRKEGMKHRDIARERGISETATRQRGGAAISKIRDFIAKNESPVGRPEPITPID